MPDHSNSHSDNTVKEGKDEKRMSLYPEMVYVIIKPNMVIFT